MRHDWEDLPVTLREFGAYGRRRCRRCGAEQVKESVHNWGRVAGYVWAPRAGRCVPLHWRRPGWGHQETHCGRYRVVRDPDLTDHRPRWRPWRAGLDEPLHTAGLPTREAAKRYCEADARGAG